MTKLIIVVLHVAQVESQVWQLVVWVLEVRQQSVKVVGENGGLETVSIRKLSPIKCGEHPTPPTFWFTKLLHGSDWASLTPSSHASQSLPQMRSYCPWRWPQGSSRSCIASLWLLLTIPAQFPAQRPGIEWCGERRRPASPSSVVSCWPQPQVPVVHLLKQ